jgi:glycosyltransferase involved in cell wall biosynthesis
MILGIDASNLRTGGSITHLSEILRVADPLASGISKVIVWSGRRTLDRLVDRPWLVKRHQRALDGNLAQRAFWQRFRLSALARAESCNALFVPGGSFAGDFHPIVTMSRNMLPFEWREARRYGLSWMTLKLMLLRETQTRSYHRADGIIFLTQYAREGVMRIVGHSESRMTTVPHGIDDRFLREPRQQKAMSEYSPEKPFRVLYVSTIDMYKHHVPVATAVAALRLQGVPVVLDLVGGAYGPALRRLRAAQQRLDPDGRFIRYRGPLPYSELHTTYAQADLCVFASSCENMPNVLLEGMASGLPIACSDRGPMPEILGDTGLYFNPEDPQSITASLRRMIDSPELRERLARASSARAREYSWRRCSSDTFSFIVEVGQTA